MPMVTEWPGEVYRISLFMGQVQSQSGKSGKESRYLAMKQQVKTSVRYCVTVCGSIDPAGAFIVTRDRPRICTGITFIWRVSRGVLHKSLHSLEQKPGCVQTLL